MKGANFLKKKIVKVEKFRKITQKLKNYVKKKQSQNYVKAKTVELRKNNIVKTVKLYQI